MFVLYLGKSNDWYYQHPGYWNYGYPYHQHNTYPIPYHYPYQQVNQPAPTPSAINPTVHVQAPAVVQHPYPYHYPHPYPYPYGYNYGYNYGYQYAYPYGYHIAPSVETKVGNFKQQKSENKQKDVDDKKSKISQ